MGKKTKVDQQQKAIGTVIIMVSSMFMVTWCGFRRMGNENS